MNKKSLLFLLLTALFAPWAAYAQLLNEDFSTGELPTGWARYSGLLSDVMNGTALTPNTAWAFGTANFVFDSHAYLRISGANCYSWLVTPTFAMEDNVQLTFNLALTLQTGTAITPGKQNDNKFVMLVTTDGGSTWNILRQWDNQGSEFVYDDIVCSSTGETVVIDLSSYAGQNIALAFYGESTEMDYLITIGSFHSNPIYHRLHIDNVRVDYIPDCDKPRNLVANNIMGYNATLNWTGDADSWIVAYKTAADADFMEVPVTEHPYTLADLIPETFYTVKVRAVCGELYSEWSSPEYFTTDAACPAPTNLSATNIIHNAATIRWTSYNESFQLRYRKQSDTDWIMVDNTTSPYRLTGLEPDTYYTVEVRANCGDDGESLWATRDLKTYACSGYIAYVTNISPTSVRAKLNGYSESFTVKYREAAIEDAPFKEDFEDDACLNDWTFISMNAANDIGNPNGAGRFSTAAHWGNYGFRFSSENAIQSGETYDQYLISPQLNTTGELKFYINCFLGTDFYVGYSTTTNDLEAFTWTEYRISYSQTWQIHRQQLPDDVKYVAFHYYYIPSIADQKFYIDDITIGTYEIEPAGSWNYVTTEETTVILDNLSVGTEYEAIVVPGCDETHESMVVSFTTPACGVGNVAMNDISFNSASIGWSGGSESFTVRYRESAVEDAPFRENFEDAASLNNWTFISMNSANDIGNSHGAGLNYNWSALHGSYGFCFSSWNPIEAGETRDQYLISTELSVTGELKFYYKLLYASNLTKLYVGYSSTTNDLEAFTWTENIGLTTTWQIHRQQLPADVKYIAIHYTSEREQYDFAYIDDITVGAYEVVPAGEWNYVTTEETTVTLDDLTDGTEYEAIVVPSCDETKESVAVSFATVACAVGNVAVSDITFNSATASWTGNSEIESYTVKYRETPHERIVLMQDFEDADSFAEWTFISMNAANDIGTNLGAGRYSVAAHHGAYGFRFSSANQKYGSGSYEQYLISPELTGAGELKFDYKKNHNNQHEYLRVGYSTTTNSLGHFTWISSFYPNLEWETYTQQLPADVKYIAINLSTERGSFVFVDDISITNNDAGPWNYITTEETTASITNLARSTEYEVVVVPSCNETLESDPVLFTTDGCWVPTNVEASNITHTTATVSWTGNSESYTVQYRANYGINEEFRDPLLPGGWTRYTGTLNANGTASLSTTNAGWYFGSNYFNNIHAYTCIFVYNKYWLVSPSFTIDNGYTLSFDVAYTAYNSTAAPDPSGTDDRFLVLISTDEKAHWTILREYNNSGSPYVLNNIPKTFQTVNDIDISAYVGQTVYIAFYGASTEANSDNTLRIDNVMCGLAGEWQAITTTQPSVTINGLTPGTGYEVIVIPSCNETLESDVITFITSSDEQKLFVTDGGWHVADNWSPAGVPTIDQDIELRANVTINGIAEARTITQGNYTITIEDGGQLKHSEYGFNNGLTATVKKNITGYGEGNGNWYLIANPVTLDITPNQENGMLNGPYDLYEWNDTVSDGLEWRNYKVDGQAFSLLSGSTGYLYANQDGTELSFYGPIRSSHNNRIVLIDNHDGSNEFGSWFLLGNPFVCDAYLIDPNYNTLACYRMNAEGTGFEAVEGAIAPMEGVLYEAPSSGYVYFTRTPPTRSGVLNMTVTQGTAMVDNVIIRFGEGNMLGKKNFREGSTMLYIPQDGKDYAVVNAGPSGEIPVNFKAERNGTYTLHFNAEEVGFSYLHLVDNLTGTDVDLMALRQAQGPASYTFEAKITDYANRFKLVFSSGGDAEGCH